MSMFEKQKLLFNQDSKVCASEPLVLPEVVPKIKSAKTGSESLLSHFHDNTAAVGSDTSAMISTAPPSKGWTAHLPVSWTVSPLLVLFVSSLFIYFFIICSSKISPENILKYFVFKHLYVF